MEEEVSTGTVMRLGEEEDLQEQDNVEEAAIWPASLLPPAHPDAASPPTWVLLELAAYIADRRDTAATASSKTRGGHAIEVTLRAASPPLLSHICVHCPGLKPTRFAAEPRIYAAADGLILLAVAVGHRFLSSNLRMLDYFLYEPASRSLELLPHPHEPPGLLPHPFSQAGFFGDKLVALLRLCHNDEEQLIMRPHGPVRSDYTIAILVGQQDRRFDLHRYRSDAGAWTRTRLRLAAGVNTPLGGGTFFSHHSDKAITLGGGFVGWADLRRGAILFLDVLLDDPQPHYVPLPPQPMTRNCDALVAQDIAVVDGGHIKFIDHRYNDDHGWTATTWTKKITGNPWKEEEGWRKVCELRASDVLVPDSMLPLLPKPLQMLRTGHPAISLRDGDDNVVYFMCKDRLRDDEAWMVAIDMVNKTLQGIVPFCAGRTIGIDRSYVQLRIPDDHPKTAPGRMKRPGLLFAGSSSKKLSVSPFQDMYTT